VVAAHAGGARPAGAHSPLQDDGDHAAARAFLGRYGKVGPDLQADLDRIARTDIPTGGHRVPAGREVLGL
jgi:hypothetical protein